MQDHIFRAYDIRGKVGSELLVEQVYDFGKALAFYFKEQDPLCSTIALGIDGRVHSNDLKKELVRGLQESGLNVVFIGLCSTPVLYFSQYWLPVQAGVMITASHNPGDYNGFKIVLNKSSVAQEQLQVVKDYFLTKKESLALKKGTYCEQFLIPAYIHFLKNLFPHLVGMELPVVFDSGNGAVGALLPQLARAFKWKNVTLLCQEVDGTYPHHEADPSTEKNMEHLKNEVQEQQAALGIGFDGDGDRMGAVTPEGELVPGDKLLAVFARPLLKKCAQAKVVCDSKCSKGLEELVTKWRGTLCVAKTGHSFIKQVMKQEQALLAGELSCHFFFKDRYFGFDDGVYAAFRLLEIIMQSSESLAQLVSVFPYSSSSPEFRLPCPLHEGPAIVKGVLEHFQKQKKGNIITLDGVKMETEYGWGLVRSSNTQSVICLRFEASSKEGLLKIRDDFIDALTHSYPKTDLEKALTW